MSNQTKPDSAVPGGDVEKRAKAMIARYFQMTGAELKEWPAYKSIAFGDAVMLMVAALYAPKQVGSSSSLSPNGCRNRLMAEGKPYPKSGCSVCKTGGMTGCPYERAVHAPQPVEAEGRDTPPPGSYEAAMVVIERDSDGTPTIWCDPEVVDLVTALNTNRLRTVASCSGHGHRPGFIALKDGRVLLVCSSLDEAQKADHVWPDINGITRVPEQPAIDLEQFTRGIRFHDADGIAGTIRRLRRYASEGSNTRNLLGQTMAEAADIMTNLLAIIDGATAGRPWPKAREVARIGDMDGNHALRVGFDSDNDVYLACTSLMGVEFCTPGSGGGKSPRTREALIALMVAMESDNAETPSRDWWAKRNGNATTPDAGARGEL